MITLAAYIGGKMNYFFVDYENVHSDGFVGIENLGENDSLHIMYTEQFKSFSFEILEKICKQKIKLYVHKVGTGAKNALDFQLSSYLGYIVAKNEGQECFYYIVSKDTGFDHLIGFWKEKSANIKRISDFSSKSETVKKAKAAKTKTVKKAKAAKTKTVKTAKATKTVKTATEKSKSINNTTTKKELLNYLTKEEYSDKILQIINKYKTKVSISNSLDKELFHDSKKTSAIYKKIKPLLNEKKKT